MRERETLERQSSQRTVYTHLTIAEPRGRAVLVMASVLGDMTVPSTKGAKPTRKLWCKQYVDL